MGVGGQFREDGKENKGQQPQKSQTGWSSRSTSNFSERTVWVSAGEPPEGLSSAFSSLILFPASLNSPWAHLGPNSAGLSKDWAAQEAKGPCSLLKHSAVMYYLPDPHQVCPRSHEWIKANPLPFLEKELKARVLLMVPLSLLCGQQTAGIEHSPWTRWGDTETNQQLKEVKTQRGQQAPTQRDATPGALGAAPASHCSIFHSGCRPHCGCWRGRALLKGPGLLLAAWPLERNIF